MICKSMDIDLNTICLKLFQITSSLIWMFAQWTRIHELTIFERNDKSENVKRFKEHNIPILYNGTRKLLSDCVFFFVFIQRTIDSISLCWSQRLNCLSCQIFNFHLIAFNRIKISRLPSHFHFYFFDVENLTN